MSPVKPHDPGAIYALMAVIGACSLTLLPVALELAVEVTRNADVSAALLWFAYVRSHVSRGLSMTEVLI